MTFKFKGGSQYITKVRFLGRGPDKDDGKIVRFEVGGRIVGWTDPIAAVDQWQEVDFTVPE